MATVQSSGMLAQDTKTARTSSAKTRRESPSLRCRDAFCATQTSVHHRMCWGLPLISPLGFIALSVLLLLFNAPSANGDFFNQIFTYYCSPNPRIADPPKPPAFLRWSNPNTWFAIAWGRPPSFPPGAIPGVGRWSWATVLIPCGSAILLDVPNLNLTYLNIRGYLRVEDVWPKRRTYQVQASFVSVQGQLAIGTPARQFRSRIVFTLRPNPNQRQPLVVGGMAYPDKGNRQKAQAVTANVGHKAFAVVGGQVSLHGMPGGRQTPSWVKLTATAFEGTDKIRVGAKLRGLWPVGATIVIASTDYSYDHAEERRVVSIASLNSKESLITLDSKLSWRHQGKPVSDLMGGWIDQRAEVALLTRNIVLQGQHEATPYEYEGGHFIVHQTLSPQYIEGVELVRMGQQGTLGRYNIHFHVCGDTQGKSLVYKNSIHNSLQRCTVVHATHNLTLSWNVAYNTSGHCFMTEEGGEQDNTFSYNLGMYTIPPKFKIPNGQETDNEPSTFWTVNPTNHLINNVAAGSGGAGYWTEFRKNVRGMSLFIPELQKIEPLHASPAGRFEGNVAHSNWMFGLRCYPKGIRLEANAQANEDYDNTVPTGTPQTFTVSKFLAYKNRRMGIFLQSSWKVGIQGSTFADNSQGVFIQANTLGVVRNSRFVGYTSNIGTPPPLWQCQREYGPIICAPIQGCQFPPSAAANVRSLARVHWQQPIFGILISGIQFMLALSPNAQITGNSFSGYDARCRPAAGVGVGLWTGGDWWDAAVSIHKSKVAPGSTAVYFTPAIYVDPITDKPWYATEGLVRDLALHDPDGSVVGGKGGYLLANDSFLVPPRVPGTQALCQPLPRSNAYKCPGLCYRTVAIQYNEPGFTPYGVGSTKKKQHGDFSYLVIKRVQTGASRVLDGNLQTYEGAGGHGTLRYFYASLQAGAVYDVSIVRGKSNASFVPGTVWVTFQDGFSNDRPCAGAVTLRLMPIDKSFQWTVNNDNGAFWSPCPGVTFSKYSHRWPVMYQYPCFNYVRVLLLRLNADFKPRMGIQVYPGKTPLQRCSGTFTQCGVVPEDDWYSFDDSGRELHSAAANKPGFQSASYRAKGWKAGKAPIGYIQYFGPQLSTKASPGGTWAPAGSQAPAVTRTTFYFRRRFTVTRLSCYGGLVLQYYPIYGLAVYLNGVEVFRYGLPKGQLTSTVLATNNTGYNSAAWWATTGVLPLSAANVAVKRLSLPQLKAGANLLAYELHMNSDRAFSWYFDSTVSLVYRC